jgi:hypothetical protein
MHDPYSRNILSYAMSSGQYLDEFYHMSILLCLASAYPPVIISM